MASTAPVWTVALRLEADPDRQPDFVLNRWRRAMKLPPCRLVWVGAVVPSPDAYRMPHVEALVDLTDTIDADLPRPLRKITFPTIALSLLIVGRVLKKASEAPEGPGGYARQHGAPGPEPRFRRSAWRVVGLPSGANMRISTAPALGLTIEPLDEHRSPLLCIFEDRPLRRCVLIPCWELFRYYYAHGPMVASRLFDFPRWKPEMPNRLLRTFDGHRFGLGRGPRRPPAPGREYAAAQLMAIVRDAAVSFAAEGQAQIRAVPPFQGSAALSCVAIPCELGDWEGLFVQQIVASEAMAEEASLSWYREHSEAQFEAAELQSAFSRAVRGLYAKRDTRGRA